MNLSAYDEVQPKVDKSKTWIIPRSKTLSSHEIAYRRFYCILSRYEPKQNEYRWFIAMTDTRDTNHNFTPVFYNESGRIRVSLASIWEKSSLHKLENIENVDIKLIDNQLDGEVYEILNI